MSKKVLAAGVLALTLALGGGAVLAGQVNAAAADKTDTTQTTQTSTTSDTTAKTKGSHQRGGGQKLDDAAVATLLGMTESDLRTARRDGKSLAAIAEEKGIEVQSVTDLVAQEMTAKLDQKLADGKISQADYDDRKADIAAKALEIVNGTHAGKGGRGHGSKADSSETQTTPVNE